MVRPLSLVQKYQASKLSGEIKKTSRFKEAYKNIRYYDFNFIHLARIPKPEVEEQTTQTLLKATSGSKCNHLR
jgi:hypothetical protein